MKFTTYSGTQYVLTDIEQTDLGYVCQLARISDHGLVNVGPGPDRFENEDFKYDVFFFKHPEVGKTFLYVHPVWQGCSTSTVQSIEDTE